MRANILLVATMLGLVACAAAGPVAKVGRLPEELGPPSEYGVLIVADPQLHNVFGGSVKQMFGVADRASKVAIRPPELNLLAPLVLEELIQEALTYLSPSSMIFLVLGDGTNIGCTSEWDLLRQSFSEAAPKMIWLMAHGNHDSYLMGTANHFIPAMTHKARNPNVAVDPATVFPPDEAWWDNVPVPLGHDWGSACAKVSANARAHPSGPMTKLRWLHRYLSHLETYGVIFDKSFGPAEGSVVPIRAAVAPSSALGKANFRLEGQWSRPIPLECNGDWDYTGSWLSFVVQAVNITSRHTAILIDTSVCETASIFSGLLNFAKTNAGLRGCLGQNQLEAIAKLVRETAPERHVIVAGHFPLSRLGTEEREELVRIMNARAKPAQWTYLSAHSHDRISVRDDNAGGREINIGSTTDWPMEAHVLRFEESSSAIVATSALRVRAYTLDYNAQRWYKRRDTPELCRHLDAAKRLAALDVAQVDEAWNEPLPNAECIAALDEAVRAYWKVQAQRDCDENPTCSQWQDFLVKHATVAAFGDQLAAAQMRIRKRFSEETYKRMVLSIAASGSRSDFKAPDASGLLK